MGVRTIAWSPLFWISVVSVATNLSSAFQLEDAVSFTSQELNKNGRQLNKRQVPDERCLIPPPLKYGHFRPSPNRCHSGDTTPACQMVPGTSVSPNWVIYYHCDPGYSMNTTKMITVCVNGKWKPNLPTCHDLASLVSVKLLVGKNNGVSVIDMNLSEQTVFLNYTQQYEGVFSPSVDYHFAKKYIFFASVDRIYRDEMVDLVVRKGTPKVVVTAGMVGPVRIAVDWVHDKLYWLSDTHKTVEMANLDGSNRAFLFNVIPNLNYPHNLGVDPYAGFIFVASNSSIWRATLDGKGLVRLKQDDEEGKMVRCIAVDHRRRRIFYSYRVLNIGITYIGSCDYDGKSSKDHPLMGRDSFVDIFTLDIYRDTLYFGHFMEDTNAYTMWSVNLTKPMPPPLTPVLEQTVAKGFMSLRVYHPSIQQNYQGARPGRTKYY